MNLQWKVWWVGASNTTLCNLNVSLITTALVDRVTNIQDRHTGLFISSFAHLLHLKSSFPYILDRHPGPHITGQHWCILYHSQIDA